MGNSRMKRVATCFKCGRGIYNEGVLTSHMDRFSQVRKYHWGCNPERRLERLERLERRRASLTR